MTENKSIKQKKKMPAITVAFILVTLFPTVSHLLIFWLPVQGSSLLLAFEDQRTGSFTLWGNFSQAIQMCLNGEEALGEGLKNTSIFFLVGLLLSLMSFFAAYMLYKKMFGSAFVRVCLYLPGAISTFMFAYLFQNLLISEGPLLSFLNGTLGLNIRTPVIMEYPMQEMIIFQIWMGLGGGLIVWFGAMTRIPLEVLEYGQLDGIGPFREFFQIIIPLVWPTFVTLFTLSIIGFFGASGPVLLFTEGDYGTYTVQYWLFEVIYTGNEDMYGVATALGWIMTILTMPLVFIGRYVMNRFGGEQQY